MGRDLWLRLRRAAGFEIFCVRRARLKLANPESLVQRPHKQCRGFYGLDLLSVRLEPAFQPLAPVIGLNHETPGKRWKSVSAVWTVPRYSTAKAPS
jgi:hypothetical protein